MKNDSLEIIEYIENSDYDEKMKNFFIKAIINELRNPDNYRYKAQYENMIESSMED